jgi:hypothetical protein
MDMFIIQPAKGHMATFLVEEELSLVPFGELFQAQASMLRRTNDFHSASQY